MNSKNLAGLAMAAVMVATAPRRGGHETVAAGFRIARTAPLPSVLGSNIGSLGRLPASLLGEALPGVLPSPTLPSAMALPAARPRLSAPALPLVAGAAASGVPATVTTAPGASWPRQLSALGEEVDGILSTRDVGGQTAGLDGIFHGTRKDPALATTPSGARDAARGEGTLAPELEQVLQPDEIYDVTIRLVADPTVTEEDRLVYYLSVLDGVIYRHDRRRYTIHVQGITGRDIRIVAGFSGVRRISSARAGSPAGPH